MDADVVKSTVGKRFDVKVDKSQDNYVIDWYFNQPSTIGVVIIVLGIVWRVNGTDGWFEKASASLRQRFKSGQEAFAADWNVAAEMNVHAIATSRKHDRLVLTVAKFRQGRRSLIRSSVNLKNLNLISRGKIHAFELKITWRKS